MNNKVLFIKYTDTLDSFKSKLDNELSSYKNDAIIFIEQAKTIFLNGVYYSNSVSPILLTNEDLDNIKDYTKIYYADGGNTVINKPEKVSAFSLQVLRGGGTSLVQILITAEPCNSPIVTYKRVFENNTWTLWTKYITSNDVSITPDPNTIPITNDNAMLYTNGIKFKPKIAQINSKGWYRVASFGEGYTIGSTVILNINRNYNNYQTESYSFAITAGYNNQISIVQLTGICLGMVIPKIRVLTSNNKISYIDIYYDLDKANTIYISGIGDMLDTQAPVLSNDIPTEYIATEFTVVSNGFKTDKSIYTNAVLMNPLRNRLESSTLTWYRVYESAGMEYIGDNIILQIAKLYGNVSTESYQFAISIAARSENVTQLSGANVSNGINIPKIRILRDSENYNRFYIDIAYKGSANNVDISGIGRGNFVCLSPSEIPDGYKANEYEIYAAFKANGFIKLSEVTDNSMLSDNNNHILHFNKGRVSYTDGGVTCHLAEIDDVNNAVNFSNTEIDNNGYEFVDLGLPSGTLWSKYYLGCSAYTDEPPAYRFGDIESTGNANTSTNFGGSWKEYKWSKDGVDNNKPNLTKYCTVAERGYNGFTDNKMEVELCDDAARIKMGGNWRIPSGNQFRELIENCTFNYITTTSQYGIKGVEAKSKINGQILFLPNIVFKDWNTYNISLLFMTRDNAAIDNTAAFLFFIICYPESLPNVSIVTKPCRFPIIPVITKNKYLTVKEANTNYLDVSKILSGATENTVLTRVNGQLVWVDLNTQIQNYLNSKSSI